MLDDGETLPLTCTTLDRVLPASLTNFFTLKSGIFIFILITFLRPRWNSNKNYDEMLVVHTLKHTQEGSPINFRCELSMLAKDRIRTVNLRNETSDTITLMATEINIETFTAPSTDNIRKNIFIDSFSCVKRTGPKCQIQMASTMQIAQMSFEIWDRTAIVGINLSRKRIRNITNY